MSHNNDKKTSEKSLRKIHDVATLNIIVKITVSCL